MTLPSDLIQEIVSELFFMENLFIRGLDSRGATASDKVLSEMMAYDQ